MSPIEGRRMLAEVLWGGRMVVESSEVVMRYVVRTVTTVNPLYIKYDYSLG